MAITSAEARPLEGESGARISTPWDCATATESLVDALSFWLKSSGVASILCRTNAHLIQVPSLISSTVRHPDPARAAPSHAPKTATTRYPNTRTQPSAVHQTAFRHYAFWIRLFSSRIVPFQIPNPMFGHQLKPSQATLLQSSQNGFRRGEEALEDMEGGSSVLGLEDVCPCTLPV